MQETQVLVSVPLLKRWVVPAMTEPAVFTGLMNVAIPVTDQDRTKALFVALGFEVRMDAELTEGFRWVEVAPPNATTRIALVVSNPGLPSGIDTGIRLAVTDARAARAKLIELGLSTGELLEWDGVPPMFSFSDFDDNRLYVTEAS
jgi:catechol 2,3-dioxygenase-like lactoylglutathione lyase family enzyme